MSGTGDTPIVLRGVSIITGSDTAGSGTAGSGLADPGPAGSAPTPLRRVDITLQDGVIAALCDSGSDSAAAQPGKRVIDAGGLVALPGLVDMHVHLREPGQTHKETLRTGTQAAARGGFTFVACMPNTSPVLDSAAEVSALRRRIREEAVVAVGIIAAVTRGSRGEELTDFAALKDAGAIALSDDGRGIQRASIMRAALHRAGEIGLPLLAHCEDESLAHGGVINEGAAARDRCLLGIPAEAESAHVARDLVLAERSAARYHVCHLSCEQSLRLVRAAKLRGQAVTCEVTPHHLLLTDLDIAGDDANYKMNPPLRTPADRQALLAGLCDGTVDAIATDHAPHAPDEKARGLLHAPFGVIGLETAFALLYTSLVETGLLSLSCLVHLLSDGPAQLLGLHSGGLRPGAAANLTLVDLHAARPIASSELRSKSRNTPFMQRVVRGWPVCTFARGRVAYSEIQNLAAQDA